MKTVWRGRMLNTVGGWRLSRNDSIGSVVLAASSSARVSLFSRVGMADCPATPLSEPDWRISHPALWTIFQNAKLICEPEAAGRWCFNHWPSSEFRRPMNHAKPYALWTPKRALLCHTPRLLHAVLAAVPSLAPFRTKCRNRNRGRFCCRMAIARTRRRTCASSPLQLRIASWSQIRKYAPHPSM